jgi:hypothetical protein
VTFYSTLGFFFLPPHRTLKNPRTSRGGLGVKAGGGGDRSGARPGHKGLVRKNHEAPSIPLSGRASPSFSPVEFLPAQKRPITRSIGPPPPAETVQCLQEGDRPGRCFLSTRPLRPGHNPSISKIIAGRKISKSAIPNSQSAIGGFVYD